MAFFFDLKRNLLPENPFPCRSYSKISNEHTSKIANEKKARNAISKFKILLIILIIMIIIVITIIKIMIL